MDSQEDPDETLSLERKLRLKHLMDEGYQLERQLAQNDSSTVLSTLQNLIEESNKIINEGDIKDRAQHTTEVVMDVNVLKMNHELLSKVLHFNMEFNENLYQNAIKKIVNQSMTPDWTVFADIVCRTTQQLNIQSTMLGAIESQLKVPVVKQKQKRQRNTLAKEKQPETVQELKRRDKGAEKVNLVHGQLVKIFKEYNCERIPFYKLIVDPNNFVNSVENTFQLAFLARDGVIGIDKGDDGHPTVRLISSAEKKTEVEPSQWICSLSMDKCLEMAKFYNIKKPMLIIELNDCDEQSQNEENDDGDE